MSPWSILFVFINSNMFGRIVALCNIYQFKIWFRHIAIAAFLILYISLYSSKRVRLNVWLFLLFFRHQNVVMVFMGLIAFHAQVDMKMFVPEGDRFVLKVKFFILISSFRKLEIIDKWRKYDIQHLQCCWDWKLNKTNN